MCGLVAMVSKKEFGFSKMETDAFTQMLFVDQLRGKDGTGIFFNAAKDNFNPIALKAAVPSSVFINQKEYEDAISTVLTKSKYIVGHNRAGTKGNAVVKNTHPFREDHIMLVHNGTLFNHKNLHPTHESDSKSICHSMAKKGVEETLKKIDGSFALIWADAKEETINFCRNYQRSLYILETPDSFFFSSEEGLAKWILSRNNITVKESKLLDVEKVFSISFKDTTKVEETKTEYRKAILYDSYKENNRVWPNFQNKETTPYVPRLPNKTKETLEYGDIIKFRSGAVHEHKHTSFLEADVLINQGLVDGAPRAIADFEDKFRIKIYGTKENLIKYANNRNLEGKIISAYQHNGKGIYFVVDHTTIRDCSDIVVIDTKTKDTICDFCGEGVNKNKIEVVDGCALCETCAIASTYSHHSH